MLGRKALKAESGAKEQLARRFAAFNAPVPTGFAKACEDIDIDVFEYVDSIAGLVQSYLSGLDVELTKADLGSELAVRLTECESRLQTLKAYKETASELAALLADCLDIEF
jgi:hypothetical protein